MIKEIEAAGGKAIGISTDVADGASVANAFEKIKASMKGGKLAAAVFNVGGKFIRKPFLELNEEEFMSGMEANGYDQSLCSSKDSPCMSDANMTSLSARVHSTSHKPACHSLSKGPPANTHPRSSSHRQRQP